MRFLPNVLLVLALPAGFAGYVIGVQVMSALPLPEDAKGILVVFVPLFVAGLCMVPCILPFLDRKAKQDLAAYRRSQESEAEEDRRAGP